MFDDNRFEPWRWIGEIILTFMIVHTIHLLILILKV